MNKKKFHLAGEVSLLIVLLINSLGVDLMSKADSGSQRSPQCRLYLTLPSRCSVSEHGIIFSRHCLSLH